MGNNFEALELVVSRLGSGRGWPADVVWNCRALGLDLFAEDFDAVGLGAVRLGAVALIAPHMVIRSVFTRIASRAAALIASSSVAQSWLTMLLTATRTSDGTLTRLGGTHPSNVPRRTCAAYFCMCDRTWCTLRDPT